MFLRAHRSGCVVVIVMTTATTTETYLVTPRKVLSSFKGPMCGLLLHQTTTFTRDRRASADMRGPRPTLASEVEGRECQRIGLLTWHFMSDRSRRSKIGDPRRGEGQGRTRGRCKCATPTITSRTGDSRGGIPDARWSRRVPAASSKPRGVEDLEPVTMSPRSFIRLLRETAGRVSTVADLCGLDGSDVRYIGVDEPFGFRCEGRTPIRYAFLGTFSRTGRGPRPRGPDRPNCSVRGGGAGQPRRSPSYMGWLLACLRSYL